MVDVAVGASIRKVLLVTLIAAVVSVVFVAHIEASSGHARGALVPTRKLSLSDLMLAASTAPDIHLRWSGTITPASPLPNHASDAPVDAFRWGVKRAFNVAAGGISGTAKPVLDEITIDRTNDQYSVPLLGKSFLSSAVATGPTFYFTDLSGTGGAALDYLEVDTTGALVTGYSNNSGGDRPTEEVTFAVAAITFKYKASSTAPLVSVTYNQVTNVCTGAC